MNSRDLQTQKPKMTWRATTTARHTASAMLLLVSTFVLLHSGTANAQSSGDPSTSESTCLGFDQIVEFDLQVADRTLESGINNSTGAIYRYAQADTGGLYDVLVEAIAINDPEPGNVFSNPVIDTDLGALPGGITTSWTWNDGPGDGAGGPITYAPSMELQFTFVETGTNTPVALDLALTTVDNDGATNGNSIVREFVEYGATPAFWLENPATTLTRTGNRLDGPPSVDPGVVVNSQTSITAVYLATSTVSWTSGHTVEDLAPNGGTAARLGALSFSCEADVAGDLVDNGLLEPSIDIQKTVYEGHDAGASCAGTELVSALSGTAVTYCFEVTNTGNTALDGITVSDPALTGATITAPAGFAGELQPGETATFYAETALLADLVNTAGVEGFVASFAPDHPNYLPPLTASDTAEVELLPPPVTVSGSVFEDLDGDGTNDAPLAGVSISLIDANGNIIDTVTTGPDGSYEFTDVPAGNYTLAQTDLPGFSSVPNGGDPNAISITVGDVSLTNQDFIDEQQPEAEPVPPTLALTGVSSTTTAIGGALLLLVGTSMMTGARRREQLQ